VRDRFGWLLCEVSHHSAETRAKASSASAVFAEPATRCARRHSTHSQSAETAASRRLFSAHSSRMLRPPTSPVVGARGGHRQPTARSNLTVSATWAATSEANCTSALFPPPPPPCSFATGSSPTLFSELPWKPQLSQRNRSTDLFAARVLALASEGEGLTWAKEMPPHEGLAGRHEGQRRSVATHAKAAAGATVAAPVADARAAAPSAAESAAGGNDGSSILLLLLLLVLASWPSQAMHMQQK
jgi:hypothetical protein